MDDFTRKFKITMDKDAEIHQILTAVYQALEEKGYNPINQIGNYGYCDAGAERRLLRKINGVVNMARIPRGATDKCRRVLLRT